MRLSAELLCRGFIVFFSCVNSFIFFLATSYCTVNESCAFVLIAITTFDFTAFQSMTSTCAKDFFKGLHSKGNITNGVDCWQTFIIF